MSETVKDGGQAFPTGDHAHGGHDGMTLRDWFAGQALAGLCAYSGSYGTTNGPGDLSDRAYQIADAMLAARDGGSHDKE